MALPDDDADNGTKETGSKKRIFVMILIMALMLGIGVVGTLYFTGMLMGNPKNQLQSQTQEILPKIEEVKKEPVYYAFDQPFTVNFETESGLRFLQVSIEMMSYDVSAIDAVSAHLPVIKNNIILLFSNQTYETLVTREGKDMLREKTLEEVQGVLRKYYGDPGIQEIYFTSFVMQ